MSLSLMAVPVFLDTTVQAPQLFHQWARTYHYGHQILPTMAIGTLLLYVYTSFKKRQAKKAWGIFTLAGLVTVAMVPFTWIVMVPTNNELFRLEAVSKLEPGVMDIIAAKELVVKWSWMHFTRCFFPLAGAILGSIGSFQ